MSNEKIGTGKRRCIIFREKGKVKLPWRGDDLSKAPVEERVLPR